MLGFYKLLIGSKASFLAHYQGQDALYQQASRFWDKLDTVALLFVLLFIGMGILVAWYYYRPFNNKAHRHYLPKYWWIMSGVCAFFCFVTTLVIAVAVASPRLNGTLILEVKLAFMNAVCSFLLYWVVSIIWCNYFKTNAYRRWLF